jgi:hypothetical protein
MVSFIVTFLWYFLFFFKIETFNYFIGLNTGVFYSISTLLNPVYMWYFDVSKLTQGKKLNFVFVLTGKN